MRTLHFWGFLIRPYEKVLTVYSLGGWRPDIKPTEELSGSTFWILAWSVPGAAFQSSQSNILGQSSVCLHYVPTCLKASCIHFHTCCMQICVEVNTYLCICICKYMQTCTYIYIDVCLLAYVVMVFRACSQGNAMWLQSSKPRTLDLGSFQSTYPSGLNTYQYQIPQRYLKIALLIV